MKKAILALLMTLVPLLAFAPARNDMYIIEYTPVHIERVISPTRIDRSYDLLIKAIGFYESCNIDSAINVKEQAYGRLQIRQCRVDAYNRVTGNNYTLNDMLNFDIAKEVFLYFAKGKTFERAAKDWNGSGPMTISYWQNVKAVAERFNLFCD